MPKANAGSAPARTVRVGLIQFDAVPEQVERNLGRMAELIQRAAKQGAHWIVFHEGTVCDYTPRLVELAEEVPAGRSTRFIADRAKESGVVVSFGLSERDGDRFHITQVFVGPNGFIDRYRKTWLWYMPDEKAGAWVGGHRNEWDRYDPGTGPSLFEIEGIKASCFICADGHSERCLGRIREMRPQVVFHPNNRVALVSPENYMHRARVVGAPLLVANRIGKSWVRDCEGGCAVYDRDGRVLAQANREGREEILVHDLKLA